MGDIGGHRQPTVLDAARGAVTLALVCCLLASCSSQGPMERQAEPRRTGSGSPTTAGEAAPRPTRDDASAALPAEPAHGPTALAGQLDLAVAMLRDRQSTATEVRRAGQFQQLAVHLLARSSDAFRRKAIAALPARTARITRGTVRAGRLLHAITSPQPTLPRWRIVAPPPRKRLLAYYRAAQRRTGVPWTYLAAIHLVETRMGRIRGTSTAGARGPMQFIPSTWELYGAGGEITDPRDAILAAARLLKDNGAPGDMAGALWHYNQSDNYVRAVSAHARAMQRSRSAYRGYWTWRVLYRHRRGTYVLPVGYPEERAVLLDRT